MNKRHCSRQYASPIMTLAVIVGAAGLFVLLRDAVAPGVPDGHGPPYPVYWWALEGSLADVGSHTGSVIFLVIVSGLLSLCTAAFIGYGQARITSWAFGCVIMIGVIGDIHSVYVPSSRDFGVGTLIQVHEAGWARFNLNRVAAYSLVACAGYCLGLAVRRWRGGTPQGYQDSQAVSRCATGHGIVFILMIAVAISRAAFLTAKEYQGADVVGESFFIGVWQSKEYWSWIGGVLSLAMMGLIASYGTYRQKSRRLAVAWAYAVVIPSFEILLSGRRFVHIGEQIIVGMAVSSTILLLSIVVGLTVWMKTLRTAR